MNEGHKRALIRQRFHIVKAGLQGFRLDDFIRLAESKKGPGKGTILPFIRGLRLSALLIYAIREFLSKSDLTANWGHIIDDDGQFCSRECDIIIHKKGNIISWNGDGGNSPVMDFKFIDQDQAVAVVSCKSYLEKGRIEKDYCQDIKKYVSQVWLFAECCPPNKVDDIRQAAVDIGYENFWSLYTWDKSTDSVSDLLEDWDNFVEQLYALKVNE